MLRVSQVGGRGGVRYLGRQLAFPNFVSTLQKILDIAQIGQTTLQMNRCDIFFFCKDTW